MNADDTGPTVLVVDDDAVDRESVKRALRGARPRPRVLEAADGDQAREIALSTQLDCIVLDYRLPGQTGTELLATLRAAGVAAPVIALTGVADAGVAVELMKAGAYDYLPKDALLPDVLVRAVLRAAEVRVAEQVAELAEKRWRQHVAMLGSLAVASPRIYASLHLDDLLDTTAQSTRSILVARRAVVSIRTGAPASPRLVEAWADHHDAPATPTESQSNLRTDRIWDLVESARRPLRCQLVQGQLHPTTSHLDPALVLAAPILDRHGAVIGILGVERSPAVPFNEADEVIVGQLSSMVAVAVENATLYRSEQEAVRAREEVLAFVSHDLRTPLSSVALGNSILRDIVPPDPDIRTVLDRIDRGVVHMQQLIDDLIDLARIDAGALHVQLANEPVAALLAAVEGIASPAALEQDVSLTIRADARAQSVHADRRRLVQVLVNLLGNAIKFTPAAGAVALQVDAVGNDVQFTIQDSGPGFHHDDLARMFDRFWQSNDRDRRGAGLGLYIARAIVESHGGRLEADSRPGEGAVFRFAVPRGT